MRPIPTSAMSGLTLHLLKAHSQAISGTEQNTTFYAHCVTTACLPQAQYHQTRSGEKGQEFVIHKQEMLESCKELQSLLL